MNNTNILKLAASLIYTIHLIGCGNGEADEAKKLGFASMEEMKEIHAKGWHTKERYEEDKAKQQGYQNSGEYRAASIKGGNSLLNTLSGTKWSMKKGMPCNINGGSYMRYDKENGRYFVVAGESKLPPKKPIVEILDDSPTILIMKISLYGSDILENTLHERNLIAGVLNLRIRMLPNGDIEESSQLIGIDVEKALKGIKAFKQNKAEVSISEACKADTPDPKPVSKSTSINPRENFTKNDKHKLVVMCVPPAHYLAKEAMNLLLTSSAETFGYAMQAGGFSKYCVAEINDIGWQSWMKNKNVLETRGNAEYWYAEMSDKDGINGVGGITYKQ